LRILRYLVDRWLTFRAWYVHRRDHVARLQLQIDQERERHQRESEQLRGDLAIAHRHIDLLTADNQKFHAMIKRDTAQVVRDEVVAQHDSRLRGTH
jgi:hypothetical protein